MFVTTKERERRYRILYVSPELVMDGLFSPLSRGGQLHWFSWDGLPEGVEVTGVCWDEYRRAFAFRLWHTSFDVVPPGEISPTIDVQVTAHNRPEPAGPVAVRRGREFL